MRSFWSDPYLWVHVAGLAAVPIALEICLLGLAVGDPLLPTQLELLLVAIVGIVPVLWMQWQKPFYIFSLLIVALKPEQLTLTQRRLLQRFKASGGRVIAVLVAGVLAFLLGKLSQLAPIAIEAAAFIPQYRGLGLLIAAIAFLGSNLFLQVPVSVLRVMLSSETKLATIEPYPLEQISQDFTLLGWRVKQILPQVQPHFEDVTDDLKVPSSEPTEPAIAEPIVPEHTTEVMANLVPGATNAAVEDVAPDSMELED
jgi:hypothetical protein